MSTKSVNIERIRRFASPLNDGDVAMLVTAVEFCGTDAGLKERLSEGLRSARDAYRKGRLLPLIRNLTEAELVWFCENHADVMHRR
jgi:hypothetical protein